MALTFASVVVVNDVSNAAGAGVQTSAVQDLTDSYEKTARCRITNGATGPTVAGSVQIQISEDTTAGNFINFGPALAGSSSNADIASFVVSLPDTARQVRVLYGGNTGQAVTFRVVIDKITGI